MPGSTFQRAFAGGELAPALGARADVAKYTQGLRTCRNFLVLRHGGVSNRPGTRFVNPVKATTGGTAGTNPSDVFAGAGGTTVTLIIDFDPVTHLGKLQFDADPSGSQIFGVNAALCTFEFTYAPWHFVSPSDPTADGTVIPGPLNLTVRHVLWYSGWRVACDLSGWPGTDPTTQAITITSPAGIPPIHGPTAPTGAPSTFLLRYVSEFAGESLLIEAGTHYLRFYKDGGLVRLTTVDAYVPADHYVIGEIVSSGGVNYYCKQDAPAGTGPPNAAFWYPMPGDIFEIETPFGPEGFKWVQSGNVITMTSSIVAPHELVVYNAVLTGVAAGIYIALQPVVLDPRIHPPTGLAVVGGAAGTLSYYYKVTAAAEGSYEESFPTPQVQVTPILAPTPAAPNVLTWTASLPGSPPVPAVEYYIYLDPIGNGTFGFIGTATGQTSFKDTGLIPDFAVTPPLPTPPIWGVDDYPRAAAYYQQRRLFANTNSAPDAVWGSRTGLPSNFTISSPLQDDDAVSFKIAGNQHNPVRNMVGLALGLVVLTDAGEWRVVGGTTKVLAPGSIDAEQETFVGTDTLTPVVVGNAILYLQTRGSILRELRFDQQVEGLAGRDLTLFAAHLVDGFTIQALDYQQTPHSTAWACRSDGTLLGLTYVHEQELWGWHRHDTGASGRFEDVCVVPEQGEDVVYVIVRRTISGGFVRYIERLERRTILNWAADSFFVDAGLSYSGAPVAVISGLDHLEGQTVAVVADGRVIYNGDPLGGQAAEFTVSGGTIPHVFSPLASIIHAGLPIRYADLETLDLDIETSAAPLRDKEKRVGSLTLLLEGSARTFLAGPDPGHLIPVRLGPTEIGSEQVPFTGQEELNVVGAFTKTGRVFIRHTDPLPFTVLGVLPNLVVGG